MNIAHWNIYDDYDRNLLLLISNSSPNCLQAREEINDRLSKDGIKATLKYYYEKHYEDKNWGMFTYAYKWKYVVTYSEHYSNPDHTIHYIRGSYCYQILTDSKGYVKCTYLNNPDLNNMSEAQAEKKAIVEIDIKRFKEIKAVKKIKKWWISLFWNPNTKVGRKRLMRSFENEEYSVW